MRYQWDTSKAALNFDKHGLSFEDAHLVLEADCFTVLDDRKNYGEKRFITFGMLRGRLVVIAHTDREDEVRIISMRKANEREQDSYQERLEANRRHARR